MSVSKRVHYSCLLIKGFTVHVGESYLTYIDLKGGVGQ